MRQHTGEMRVIGPRELDHLEDVINVLFAMARHEAWTEEAAAKVSHAYQLITRERNRLMTAKLTQTSKGRDR